MNKHVLWIALALMLPLTGMAGSTAAPDPLLQNDLNGYQGQNLNDGYTAGTASLMYQAYTDAAHVATDIAHIDQQDSYGGHGSRQAWQSAALEANQIATAQQNLANQQQVLQQQAEASANTTQVQASSIAPAVAQSGAASGQAAASQDFTIQTSTIQWQTGVSSGQVTPSSSVAYALAGAGEQALMNGLSTSGYQANVSAYTAYQTAMACGVVPGCAAFWMGVNAMYQSEADADYAANVAEAPVLAGIDDAAALAAATTDAQHLFQQINSMTGTQQGVAVQYTPAPIIISNSTRYTQVANTDWNSMQAADSQNLQAGINASQAWQADSAAQTSVNAANQIATYDQSMAHRSSRVDYRAWMGAANVARQVENQNQMAASGQRVIQQRNVNQGDSSYVTSMTLAPAVGTELDGAASSAAGNDATRVLQQIHNITGN